MRNAGDIQMCDNANKILYDDSIRSKCLRPIMVQPPRFQLLTRRTLRSPQLSYLIEIRTKAKESRCLGYLLLLY